VRHPEKEIKYAISYLCNDIKGENIEIYGMSLLHNLLCDPPTGPLYKTLIESGLAPAFGPGNGYDCYNRQSSFTIGV
jgi:Zn-dependent M16 (insulinase) family peptidase